MKMIWKGMLFMCASSLLSTAWAQDRQTSQAATDYPTKPLRIVVGLAAGGATDIMARLVGQKLNEVLGQPAIVDNRAGAAGSIGAAIVAKAQPDGYTVLAISSSYAINPSLYELPFDSIRDFSPVVQTAQAPFLLVVGSSMPVQTVRDLIALAKAKPRTLNFSSGGTGGSGHLAGELFKRMAGIEVDHIPYRGGAPALVEVMSGQVHFTFSAIVAGLQQWRAGRLKALGVTSAKRSRAAPDVPTIAEAGVPGYEVMTWYGILAPAGTPDAIVHKLNGAVKKIVHMPDVAERMLADGAEPVGNAPAEFGKHLAAEINRFNKIARDAGLKVQKAASR
ncbi:MAG: tripartite tricarboxylate transporter substrate binding protein [Burkholderiales bacterium]|nr:tripartite tricarboxylate transporter substrate binding protein [Burkholderiales bacterium]